MRANRTLLAAVVLGIPTILGLKPGAAIAAVCDVSAFNCPSSGTCTITGTWNIDSDCTLDFGARSVELKGTFQASALGGSFVVRATSVTLNAGKLKSIGDLSHGGGDISVLVTNSFTMQGAAPRIDTSGNGGGGTIRVRAVGITLTTGTITADGGSGTTCGPGGGIDLDALTGPLTAAATIRSISSGSDCEGGSILLEGASVYVSGDLDARGGAAASEDAITIMATAGDIVVSGSASLKADGTGQPEGSGADAGAIALSAASGGISLGGALLSLTGNAPDGIGGVLILDATGNIQVTAHVLAYGSSAGSGGALFASTNGNVTLLGDITATGGQTYPDAEGGLVEVSAGGTTTVSSIVDVSAAFGGGVIIENGGDVTVGGKILARGSHGDGGRVAVLGCHVNLNGTLDAGASNGGAGGIVESFGEAITASSTARILATPCVAGLCTSFTTRTGNVVIDPHALISPSPIVTIDPDLPPC